MDNNTIEEKFNQIFDAKIKPYVSSLENERLSIKKFVQSMLPVNILLFIGVFVLIGGIALKFIPPKISAISIISILVIFTPISIITQLKIKKLRKRIKEETFPPLLTVFGNLQIGQKDCITLKELKQSGLFPRATKKTNSI
jgi:ABC-type multidrug transport system fused ATPase/permease subunit